MDKYSLKGKMLTIRIPKEIFDLITDKKIYKVEGEIKERLGDKITSIQAEASLCFMSSSTHLNNIILHSREEWSDEEIQKTLNIAEGVIQKELPAKRYTVYCECQ